MKIFWLDQAATLKRLQQAAARLAEEHPEIEQIVLFGSLARGDAGPGSDADLLIILRDSALPVFTRSVHYRPDGVGIGVDVFAYTRAETEAMQAAGNTFVSDALREGRSLISVS